MGVVPGIAEYVSEFTSNAAMGQNGYLKDVGLIVPPRAALMDLMTPPSPDESAATATEAAAGGNLTVAAIFEKMTAAFVADAAAGVDVVFQYCIGGPTGGDWSVAIKDQTCTVTKGQADQAACTLKIDDADFIRLITGELPAMQAYTSGQLTIEGDIMKSQLIEKLFQLNA